MRVGWTLRLYVAIVCLLSLAPIVMLLLISFTGQQYAGFPPQSYGVQWWVAAFHASDYRDAFVFSVLTALTSALIATLVASLAAFGIVRHPRGGVKALATVAFAPLLIPQFVIGISLIDLLTSLNISLAPAGIVIGGILIGIPFATRLVMSNLTAIPDTLEKASSGLGASRWYTIRRVMLPQMAPGIAAAFIMSFVVAFDELDVAIFLILPGRVTMPVQIFNDIQLSSSPLPLAASAMLLCVGVVIMLVLDRTIGILRVLVPGSRNVR
jgi:putative spermidine/putrescine transport system permease protein